MRVGFLIQLIAETGGLGQACVGLPYVPEPLAVVRQSLGFLCNGKEPGPPQMIGGGLQRDGRGRVEELGD